MIDQFEVECENCGRIQTVSAEELPQCEDCDSSNLTQIEPA